MALYPIICTAMDYTLLQNYVRSISDSIRSKHPRFNASKCKTMFISRNKTNSLPLPEILLDGTELKRVQSYEYLGITITSNLSWNPHITNCCNKTRTRD